MSNGNARQTVLAIISMLVIAGSVAWIYFTELAPPKINVVLHQVIGEVMAEETARLLGRKGQVVVVALDPHAAPELRTQLETFRETLRKLGGVAIKETVFVDTEN